MSKLPKSLEQRMNEIANAYANTDPVIDIERACNHGFQACADELLPQNEALRDALEYCAINKAKAIEQLDSMNQNCISLLLHESRMAQLQSENAKLKDKLLWLVMHSIECTAISKAKGCEILGVPLIDFETLKVPNE